MNQKGGNFGRCFFFEKQKTMIVDGVLEASLIQVHQKEKNWTATKWLSVKMVFRLWIKFAQILMGIGGYTFHHPIGRWKF